MNKLEFQKEYRARTANACTKKYEKTKPGFLMRMYRNMKSRIEGIQWKKRKLYEGKYLLPKEEFYKWANNNQAFHELFMAWVNSGYSRKMAPSIDRIDPEKGYSIDNMRLVTMSENSRTSTHIKRKVIQMDINGNHIAMWDSLTSASKSIGKDNPGNIVCACNGRIKTAYGYKWAYV